MGITSIFRFFLARSIELFIICTLLVLIPNLPPKGSFNKSIKITPSKPLEGKLSLNNKLDDVEIWHKGDFIGPEAFANLNNELYTSLQTGDVVKLTGANHITPVVKFGKPCKATYEERICGRPLGLTFDKNGKLYVVDSYYGIFRVNVKSGEKERLVAPNTVINEESVKLLNSIAIGNDGDIYFTHSSSEFNLDDGVFSMLADPSGRLIRYNPTTKIFQVLIRDLAFANGVALSDTGDFVVVAETGRKRILRYYLRGLKKGTYDIFVDGLPGLPDNLKSDGKGGFLVPLIWTTDSDHPNPLLSISQFPLLRKIVARLMGIVQYAFKKVDEYYPNEFSLKAIHSIGHFSSTPNWLIPKRVTLLRLNSNGEILDSLHTMNKKFNGFSEMHIMGDQLYLGTPFNDYIGKIALKKVGWNDLIPQAKTAKPAAASTTTPKSAPTASTTPKPTPTASTTPKPTPTASTTPKPTPAASTTPKPTPAASTTPKPATASTTTARPAATTKALPNPSEKSTITEPERKRALPATKPAPAQKTN